MLNKSEIKKLILIFFGWRFLTFLIAYIASFFLKYDPSFPYTQRLADDTGLPQWFYSWGNFDGVHYLTIIDHGYLGTGLIQAFFPFYPIISKFLNIFTQNSFWSAFIISNVCAFVLLVLFYILLKLQMPKIKWLAILILVLFPTSFYFLAIYNESLFLSLILASFIFIKKKQWVLAGLMAGLASATRLVGIFMVFTLLYELWLNLSRENKNSIKDYLKNHYRQIISILFASLGLLSYMFYLWITFSDPLYFFNVQSEFGAGRQTQLVTLPQVIWRYIKILLTARPFDLKYFAYFQEFYLSIASLIILIFSYKKIKTSYLLFSLGAFILPTLTGTFSSMPRYIIVLFPIYMWLAMFLIDKPRLKILILTTSTFFLILNTILFIQGYWVA